MARSGVSGGNGAVGVYVVVFGGARSTATSRKGRATFVVFFIFFLDMIYTKYC